MSRRLRGAIVVFALLTLAEVGDVIGLVLTLRDPGPAAAQLGITVPYQMVRAIVLLLLASQIAIGAIIALVGLLLRRWIGFRVGALLCSVGCIIYGGFQLISAIVQLGSIPLALVGIIYTALGWLTFWLGNSPVPAAPAPRSEL